MSNLFTPVPSFSLPLTKGQDLVIDFQNEDDSGADLDYPGGTTVTLVIDGPTPVSQAATISGNHASVYVSHTTVDNIIARQTWRCVIVDPGSPNVNIVPMNGTTARFDGN